MTVMNSSHHMYLNICHGFWWRSWKLLRVTGSFCLLFSLNTPPLFFSLNINLCPTWDSFFRKVCDGSQDERAVCTKWDDRPGQVFRKSPHRWCHQQLEQGWGGGHLIMRRSCGFLANMVAHRLVTELNSSHAFPQRTTSVWVLSSKTQNLFTSF